MEENVKALYSSFEFVGTPVIPKERFYANTKSEKGFINSKIQFGIKTSDSNSVFVEMSGGYNTKEKNIIKTLDKDNKKIEIAWEDRLDKAVMSNVADFKKIKVQTNKDSEVQEFVSTYDAVESLKNGLDANTVYYVRGEMKIERYYSDKIGQYLVTIKYIPTTIKVANEDEKLRAVANIEFIFNKESLDESTFNEDKKVHVLAYVTTYDKDIKSNIFVPINFVINGERVDLENPVHKAKFDFLKECFKVKSKKYFQTQWKCSIVRGVETEEISLDDLTDFQKEQIQLGVKTFEEVKAGLRDKKAGNKINEIRLTTPTEKYPEGAIETELTDDDLIIPQKTAEKFEDILNNQPPKVSEDVDDLFN